MNSKIVITFNNIPDEDSQLVIVDSAYPSIDLKTIFKTIPVNQYEVARSNSRYNAATFYYQYIRVQYANVFYTFSALNGVVTIESSSILSSFSVTSNTTAGKVTTVITNATGSGIPTEIPVGDRTDINDASQITFANSPIHLRLQNAATDATIEQATVYLWIWNGAQNKTLNSPNLTLFKKKVSSDDKYINFQVADYIKAFLENPDNAPNTNQPNFAYNEATPPAITGVGVFWQIITDITSSGVTVRTTHETKFATLGYRWNYEQNLIANNGLSIGGSTGFIKGNERWYNEKIHNYIKQSFDLTKTVANGTTGNIVKTESVTPPAAWTRCSRDSSLVVYLNKLGLWDMFTPHGKITVSSDVEADEQNKSYRDPSQIDNTFTHSKLKSSPDVEQNYVINTGSLTEDMISQIEEIIYSPKIYLILFNGDVQTSSTVGITIDNTNVTIDDTNITIDSATVTEELEGKFKSFIQVPVIPTDRNFVRKNRVNDKNEINYNLKFKETNNKILDIR